MAYPLLGTLLRTARTAVDLEQRDVARQLGVGQQAVSSWERGTSRPRATQLPALCCLLDLRIEDVRLAGEYELARALARAPKLLLLPFENLSDEAFEAFCRDLFHGLYPGRAVTRNGSTGYKQYGVDVIVDGKAERIGVQCKRHRTFGPRDVEKALAEVTPEARVTRGVIVLSRPTATPATRLAITARANWRACGICRSTHNLPSLTAIFLDCANRSSESENPHPGWKSLNSTQLLRADRGTTETLNFLGAATNT